jgi:hypothetical protein
MTSVGSTVGCIKIVAVNFKFLYGDVPYVFWPTGGFLTDTLVSSWETVNAEETRKSLGFVWQIDEGLVNVCGNRAKK